MSKITIDLRMIKASGIGTYLYNLIPLIIKEKPQYDFVLLGMDKGLKEIPWTDQSNITIRNCRSGIYTIQEQVELCRNIPNDTKLFWSPHYNIPLLYRGKLLVTVHDLFHLAMPQMVSGIHKRVYAKLMFSKVSSNADAIICISEFTKKELIRFTHCQEQKLHLVHNGMDQSWHNITKERFSCQKPFLLFVGNVKPNKNLVNLIKAFDLIKNNISQDLVIVGKKEGFITGDDAVFKAAEGLGNRIRFTGHIDKATLIQYYKHADALVFPSFYEGFGLPPLEAMICGCPVLVSNAASLPEVCGDAALYCNPFNVEDIAVKIYEIINNLELRKTLISNGEKRVLLFTWDECAQKTLKVIEKVLA